MVGTRVSPGKARPQERPAAERRTVERPGSPQPLQRGLGNRIVAHELAARGAAGPGAALPHLERLEAAFGGMSLRGVRAHFGAAARQSAADLGARAYAFGEDVVFRDPSPSLRTVAHEAAHVIQQRVGVAAPVGRVGDVHERHADAVAARVVAGESAAPLFAGLTSAGPRRPALQRDGDDEDEAEVDAGQHAEVAEIKAVLAGALRQGHEKLAAEFLRVSAQWFKRRSPAIRKLDQELAENDLAGARETAYLWIGWKGRDSARSAAVLGLIAALEESSALSRANAEAIAVPLDYLFRARDWNRIRADYARGALHYDEELGPEKDGTFDMDEARDERAGMNVLLAFRLRLTLLKREDEGKMHNLPYEGSSVLQAVHDGLGQDFGWNYGAGTESPTSDIDSNLSGKGTEEAVRRFNAIFRAVWHREAGTVFDVNVYARDFLPEKGSAPALNREFHEEQANPAFGLAGGAQENALGFADFQGKYALHEKAVRFEVPLDRGSGAYDRAIESERVYALVKTCMDMSPADWGAFKAAHVIAAARTDEAKADGKDRKGKLEGVLARVEQIVEARAQAIAGRIEEIRAEGGHDHDDRDLDMRAQNELYAERLAEVAQLRAQLADPGTEDRDGVSARLTDALHRSLIYANESYVTGAAVQHVVLDKQMLSARAKDPLRLKQAGPKPKNLKLRLTTERYQHSLHEQLGFAFREFELYAGNPEKALLKASKYIYRLGNAAKHIGRDVGKPIAALEEVRDFGKRLLALKVTPAEAQGRVALGEVLAAFQIDPGRPAEWLPRVKARLIGFSASVSAVLA